MHLVAAWIVVASVLGFALAVHDKRQARRSAGRVPERLLLLLALAGAWPGELLAFLLVHHKTRKGRFFGPFLLLATLNAVLLWLLWRRDLLP